jgi:transposase
MAYFLGCDVSKRKLDLCLIDEVGTQIWADQVANEEADIAAYLMTVTGNYVDVACVVEATGCYHLPLAEVAHVLGIPCRVYNPLLTKQQIKATVRGKKTDRTDALMIARLGLRGEGRQYLPEAYLSSKYLARGRSRLVQLRGAVTRYETHLSSRLGPEFSSPEMAAALEDVQTALSTAVQCFKRDMVAATPENLSQRLQSIPGVGPYIAASVIGEIQDMRRFATSKQLIAYAGLDPRIRQSGHTLNATGRLTKRGSNYLRHSMFLAASVARRCDPRFKALYEKKRAEGKTYTVAVCVVARKLLTIIRAVWVHDEDYDRKLCAGVDTNI